jgi:hypothetical protein
MGSIGISVGGIRIAIDRGGTFTDVSVYTGNNNTRWLTRKSSVLHLCLVKMIFLSNYYRWILAAIKMRPWKRSDEFWRRLRDGHIPRARRFLCKELVRTAVTCYGVYALERFVSNRS